MPQYNGKFAVAGYCFGGRYAFLAAARLHADAALSFHGANIGLHHRRSVECQMPGQLPLRRSEDHVAPMEEVNAIREALAANKDAEIFDYAGVGHSFTAVSRPTH